MLRYPGPAAAVVARCLEPPSPAAVTRAVTELCRLDALTADERLTPLGTHLASLPVDVRIGKLMLVGAIFGAADDVLTIAAILSGRSPFLSPMERRSEADASKRSFATGQSDHLTSLSAYRAFDRAGASRFDMARERFLGVKTLQTIAQVKRQLLELMSDAGFVRRGLRARAVEALGRRVDGSDGVRLALEDDSPLGGGSGGGGGAAADACFRCGRRGHLARDCDGDAAAGDCGGGAGGNDVPRPRVLLSADDAWKRESLDVPLLKALLTAALYPQVITVTRAGGKQLRFHVREDSGAVVEVASALSPSSFVPRDASALPVLTPLDTSCPPAVHPSSVNAKEARAHPSSFSLTSLLPLTHTRAPHSPDVVREQLSGVPGVRAHHARVRARLLRRLPLRAPPLRRAPPRGEGGAPQRPAGGHRRRVDPVQPAQKVSRAHRVHPGADGRRPARQSGAPRGGRLRRGAPHFGRGGGAARDAGVRGGEQI